MNRLKTILLIVLGLVATNARPDDWTATGQKAFDSLKNAEIFRFGNGRAGGASPSEKSVIVLLNERNPQQVFQKLLQERSLAARLYALTVQRSFDTNRFNQNIKPYSSMTNQVTVMEGCLINSRPVSQIAAEIRAGRFDGVWPKK